MMDCDGTTSCVIPAGLVGRRALGGIQHYVLMHVDKAGRHRASVAVYDDGAVHADRLCRNLANMIALNQDVHPRL